MGGEKIACWLLAGWLVGVCLSWGYNYHYTCALATGASPCTGAASVFWPLAVPAHISYRVFAP